MGATPTDHIAVDAIAVTVEKRLRRKAISFPEERRAHPGSGGRAGGAPMRGWSVPAGAVVLVLLAVAPTAGALAGAVDREGLAVFAADAEAWAFSVDVGNPGAFGPLTSHTKASIDSSPYAVGAAGLVDPGLLGGAVGEVILGAPAPAYCESAYPAGPPEANCAAPAGEGGVQVGQAHTASSDRPKATSTARYGRLIFNEGGPEVPTVSVNSQSTIAVTTATESGVEAYSSVALQGVSLAGGAVRIESLRLGRAARAEGTEQSSTTSSEVALSGISVAGQTVDPGRDALQALIDAARAAYGDRLQVSAGELVDERTPDGKLSGQTSGLVVRWQPSPDRWARAILGYARVMAYGVPMAGDTILDTVIEAPLPEGPPGRPIEGRPVVPDDVGSLQPPAPAPASPPAAGLAGREAASDVPAGLVSSAGTAPPPTDDMTQSATPATIGATMPYRRPAVRWVSPFLVVAKMANTSQAGWLVAALASLLLVHRVAAGSSRIARNHRSELPAGSPTPPCLPPWTRMTAQPRNLRRSAATGGSTIKFYDFLLYTLLAALRWWDCIRSSGRRTLGGAPVGVPDP